MAVSALHAGFLDVSGMGESYRLLGVGLRYYHQDD